MVEDETASMPVRLFVGGLTPIELHGLFRDPVKITLLYLFN